jgi:hypothetical protein
MESIGEHYMERTTQARAVYQNEKARERKELQERYKRERMVDERRIERAFEVGRIPDPERRTIERPREGPQHDRGSQGRGGQMYML